MDELKVENFLCFALYSASRAMTNLYRHYLDELELTYPQFLVLVVLWGEDGQNVNSIANQLCLDNGTITPLLKRLESKKIIKRKRSKIDERIVEIWLTENGKSLKKNLPKIAMPMLDDLGMDANEVQSFAKKIHHVREKIEASMALKSEHA